jgi:CitB family two-component system sensor histidine kinase CitS
MTIVISLIAVFLYVDHKQIYDAKAKISLQTAKTISFMPTIIESFYSNTSSLQALTEHIKSQVDADFIVIIDRDGQILSHPDPGEIGGTIPIVDNYKAIVFGGYNSMKSTEMIGPSLVGKAPIFNEEKQIVGVVTVGYLIENIESEIFSKTKSILSFVSILLLLGIIGSVFLARSIRKDTYGLEPRQIAALYRDNHSILSSLNEGIIAIDKKGKITLINFAARKILNLTENYENQPIQLALPFIESSEIFGNEKKTVSNKEIMLQGKMIILNSMPIYQDHMIVGWVATFRDKTDLKELVDKLSEVERYSEDLRAQTHEFTNKLYVIFGFLQLGNYEDAVKMLQIEIDTNDTINKLVFEQISDPKVQAILLGKIGRASEKKITFQIDDNSSLGILPEHIDSTQLTIIISNLLDNAFDEVSENKDKRVSFFTLDFGQYIIFEVTDNGKGIPDDKLNCIFKPGYSSKNEVGRGYGLANVDAVVKELNGTIQVSSEPNRTSFTVYLPKDKNMGG